MHQVTYNSTIYKRDLIGIEGSTTNIYTLLQLLLYRILHNLYSYNYAFVFHQSL